jgi:hypothetical protein
MRVMETGVQRFGKKVKVDVDVETEAWSKIVDHIASKINQMPSKPAAKGRMKAKMAEMAAPLHTFRIAWRNEVMHPRRSFTMPEALEIFRTTRLFMQKLADVV